MFSLSRPLGIEDYITGLVDYLQQLRFLNDINKYMKTLQLFTSNLQNAKTYIVYKSLLKMLRNECMGHINSNLNAGNTKGGSITVPLTSCLTGLDQSVLQMKTKMVSCHTTDSKPVKQEVNGAVILQNVSEVSLTVTKLLYDNSFLQKDGKVRHAYQ